jgi:hypothetical protein
MAGLCYPKMRNIRATRPMVTRKIVMFAEMLSFAAVCWQRRRKQQGPSSSEHGPCCLPGPNDLSRARWLSYDSSASALWASGGTLAGVGEYARKRAYTWSLDEVEVVVGPVQSRLLEFLTRTLGIT